MKLLIIILVTLVLSVWVGIKVVTDPGYMLMAYGHWIVELPLWLAILGLVAGSALSCYLLRLVILLLGLPSHWRCYGRRRRQQKEECLHTQSLLALLYQKPHDWGRLLQALPLLQKKRLIPKRQVHWLKQQSYQGLLEEAARQSHVSDLQQTWDMIPRLWKRDLVILSAYVNGLIKHNCHDQAENLTRKTLHKRWDSQLVRSYGLIKSTKPEQQLRTAERWLSHHPQDANLLLSLGRICERIQLWGKANDYLKASLVRAPKIETYRALGKLFEQLGQPQTALQYYRDGV